MSGSDSGADVPERGRAQQRPGVAERLTQILDVFAAGPETILLEDIIRITELPRSTAYRLLQQLVDLGWLRHALPGYRLGMRSLSLGTGGGGSYDTLRAAAATALSRVHIATGAVAHLAVLDGPMIRYLDKIGGPYAETVPSHIGKKLPADRSICGLSLLSRLEPEEVDTLVPHTSSASPLWEQPSLHSTLNRVRQRGGIAFAPASRSHLNIGVVAALIPTSAGATAVIGVAAVGLERLERIVPRVLHAARETSERMHSQLA
jgi:DNA-binding IclR family transcriptional regulator